MEKVDFAVDGAELDFPEAVVVGVIAGKLTLLRLEESVAVSAVLTAEVNLICDRCLDNFDTKVDFEFEREYVYDRKAESEDGLYVDKYMNIDLAVPIYDELLLAIPTKNLCKEKCLGICPSCGHNLNHEECECIIK